MNPHPSGMDMLGRAPGRPLRTVSDLRAFLRAPPEDTLYFQTGKSPPPEAIIRLCRRLPETVAAGRSFAFGNLFADLEASGLPCTQAAVLFSQALSAGELGMPYQHFAGLCLVTCEGETRPRAVIAEADAQGRPGLFAFLQPVHGGLGLSAYGEMAFPVGGVASIRLAGDASQDDVDTVISASHILITMLGVLADTRVPMKRWNPDEALSAARRKAGKPPLASYWQAGRYSTPIKPKSGRDKGAAKAAGGRNRSPVPHERRGHARRLATGRSVWVRAARIGELARHLSRRREFYNVEA